MALYKKEEIDESTQREFLRTFNPPKVPQEFLKELSDPITKEECEEALKLMKKEGSPGIDGLTVKFFLKFWIELGIFFL